MKSWVSRHSPLQGEWIRMSPYWSDFGEKKIEFVYRSKVGTRRG